MINQGDPNQLLKTLGSKDEISKPVNNTSQVPAQVGCQLVLMLNISNLHLNEVFVD